VSFRAFWPLTSLFLFPSPPRITVTHFASLGCLWTPLLPCACHCGYPWFTICLATPSRDIQWTQCSSSTLTQWCICAKQHNMVERTPWVQWAVFVQLILVRQHHLPACVFMQNMCVCLQIDNIWLRKKLPVVVGGTNYYIEALLWDFLLQSPQAIADCCLLLLAVGRERNRLLIHHKLRTLLAQCSTSNYTRMSMYCQ